MINHAAPAPALARHIVTPEGVGVEFHIGTRSARLAAFMTDVVLQAITIAALALLFGWLGIASQGLIQLIVFAVWNFYFIFFETRWGGITPGKRWLGIRVMDAQGRKLELGAILVRNLVRSIEVWLPLMLYLSVSTQPDRSGLLMLLIAIWGISGAAFPLFSKHHQRIGDLLAGTWVVEIPKAELLLDLSQARISAAPPPGAMGFANHRVFAFTDEQLSHYGEYELTVLETALRRDPSTPGHFESFDSIATTIMRKIGYREALRPGDSSVFLHQFYASQRATLEKRLLMGKRRKDKFNN